jgi:GTP-binding protein
VTEEKFSATELEAGRKLFARTCVFTRAVANVEGLPEEGAAEIAFIGRSNVGKSSLVNALTGQKALARASNTPGRTQELIFFDLDGALTLVDMPGYGFAAAPKAKAEAWTALARAYLRGRARLARALVLIDSRRGVKDIDIGTMKALDTSAVSYAVVLTKIDQVKPAERAALEAATLEHLRKRPAAYPHVFVTSSQDGDGIADLRAAILVWLEERSNRV